MTEDEFMSRVLAILPSATFDMDNDGQYVIYTGLTFDGMGNVIPFVAGE